MAKDAAKGTTKGFAKTSLSFAITFILIAGSIFFTINREERIFLQALRSDLQPLYAPKSSVQWELCGQEGDLCVSLSESIGRVKYFAGGAMRIADFRLANNAGVINCGAALIGKKPSPDLKLKCYIEAGTNVLMLSQILGGGFYGFTKLEIAAFRSLTELKEKMMAHSLHAIGESDEGLLNHFSVDGAGSSLGAAKDTFAAGILFDGDHPLESSPRPCVLLAAFQVMLFPYSASMRLKVKRSYRLFLCMRQAKSYSSLIGHGKR